MSMKLEPRTFRIEWDLHAWSGIVASTFLFVIFFTGIFSLVHEELHAWQSPALQVSNEAPPDGRAPSFDALLAVTKQHTAIPEGGDVGFSFDGTRIGYAWISHAPTELEKELTIDLASGQLVPEHSRLADELYNMHFFYRVPGGQQLAGVIAVALFISVVAGLLIHLKDLKRQFWSFRPRLRLRFATSDAHKVLGVFGLPFTMMFGWTGALLGLWGLAFTGITGAAFQGDMERAVRARGEESWEREPAGKPAAMLSLDALVGRARAAADARDTQLSWMGVQLYGDERALARVYFKSEGFEAARYVVLDARDGAVVRTHRDAPPSAGLERVLFALHYASYGGMLVNALYMLLAFAVCAVIVTGNIVWLERRDPKREHRGNRFVERLTSGVCAGCVLGTAAYFAANRLLPSGIEARGDWEFGVYLAVWGFAALSAFLPRWSARQHAFAQSAAASALFLFASRDVPRVLVIDLMLLVLAIACGGLAWLLASFAPERGLEK